MRFIAESNPRWERFAAREPYFAVFTSPEYLRANLDRASRRQFFFSGEELVAAMFRTIEQFLVPGYGPSTALEYGCGVGRLAIPIAARVANVAAVDVSPAMLAVARENARELAAPHIAFETARDFFADRRTFELVTCYLVLQRMPPSEGLELIRALLERIAPGGVGVFHVPYRSASNGLRDAARWLRERVPPVNGALNVLRRKPFDEPFIATHVYDLDDVFALLDSSGFVTNHMHVAFEPHGEIGGALLYVRRPEEFGNKREESREPAPECVIDVREIIASTPIEELNRTAEEYFSKLTNWDYHLAKPFVTSDEAATLLMNLSTVLQSLRLAPGMSVLDFGAGTGWLSRIVTQLGGEAILLDVSPTALKIAQELYQRMPVIGERPAPRFLPFDGRHVDLPDESVDRIISFDAFHHAPHPEEMVAELARVLRPGGIAAFAEPGPNHSRSPQSQFEMRLHRVLENDVDIHSIWRAAQRAGFSKLTMTLYHVAPFRLSLADYEDFLTGGPTVNRWVQSSRDFLRDVRNFVMTKGGEERVDSRTIHGLACAITVTPAAAPRAGEPLLFDAVVTNSGSATWLPSDARFGGVALGAHLYDAKGALLNFDLHWQPLGDPPREIEPGESIDVRVTLPALAAGRYRIEFDCVAAEVTWFAQVGARGATTLVVDVV